MKVDTLQYRHGGPWDRGSADAYYMRPYDPHYYRGETNLSERVGSKDMTPEEIKAYDDGFFEQAEFKRWI